MVDAPEHEKIEPTSPTGVEALGFSATPEALASNGYLVGQAGVGPPNKDAAPASIACVAVIDKHTFTRECIISWLRVVSGDVEIVSFANPREAEQVNRKFDLILYHYRHDEANEFHSVSWRALMTIAPAVMLSLGGNAGFILEEFKKGLRGYILSETTTLEVAIGILRLIRAGGSFVPFGALQASDVADAPRRAGYQFTPREKSIIALLKRGRANKIIAHELQISESTVKVHIRNIMGKLKVRNRTEIVLRVLGGTEAARASPRPTAASNTSVAS